MNDLNDFNFLLCAFVVGMVCGLLTRCGEQDIGVTDVVRTDTVVKWDTVCIAEPVATDSVVIRYVTRWLTVADKPDTNVSGTVEEPYADELVNDVVANNIPPDSVRVILPFTQKTYETDEYKAWVSGYEPEIDSINIYRRTDVLTHTLYTDKARRRWSCVVGIGAGVTRKGEVSPMVGVTFGYKLF